jgi:hypothetical protein
MQAGETLIGSSDDADVQLGGALVEPQHAVISVTETSVIFSVTGESIAFVNGS